MESSSPRLDSVPVLFSLSNKVGEGGIGYRSMHRSMYTHTYTWLKLHYVGDAGDLYRIRTLLFHISSRDLSRSLLNLRLEVIDFRFVYCSLKFILSFYSIGADLLYHILSKDKIRDY